MSQVSSGYRLALPIPALTLQDGKFQFVQLPAGSTIQIEDPNPDASGMIQGRYNRLSVRMFLVDVQDRAEALATDGSETPSEADPGFTYSPCSPRLH